VLSVLGDNRDGQTAVLYLRKNALEFELPQPEISLGGLGAESITFPFNPA